MRRHVIAAGVLLMLTSGAAPAAAQAYLVPYIGYDFGGDAGSCPALLTDCSEKKVNYGVSVGFMAKGIIGVEEDLGFAPDFFGKSATLGGNGVFSAMTNVVVGLPLGPVRPYASAGIGLLKTHVDFSGSSLFTSFGDSSFGYGIGGGVMLLFPHHVGVRGDLRYIRSASDLNIFGTALAATKLSYSRVTVGLVIH
jgi:opacity protein-like surface antigen